MKTEKLLFATMIIFVVVSGISNADEGGFNPVIPKITILNEPIKVQSASAGNSVPINVNFRVDNLQMLKPQICCICELDETNFELETIEKPLISPFVGMDDLRQLDYSRMPHRCYYSVSIIPTNPQPDAPKWTKWWTKGNYVFKLKYDAGKATASKIFSFTIP